MADGKVTGWYGAGKEPPANWNRPKWRSLPTKMVRLPVSLEDALVKIAKDADATDDPIAYLESLRPGGAPPAPTAPPPPVDGDITAMNVAQLRKLAAARGMAGAARANKSALLEFLS
jgi:hypothetical protein